jgi:hypothetical protein
MGDNPCKCEDFWLYRPSVLIMNPTFCPRVACGTEVANVFTRAIIVSLVVGALFSVLYGYHAIIIAFVLMIVVMAPTVYGFIYADELPAATQCVRSPKVQAPQPFIAPMKVEGFKDAAAAAASAFTYPTPANPFMNPLPGEAPVRPVAAPIDDKSVKQELDDYFRIQWFSDPTDVFGKNQSQRQFITMPVTTTPSDIDAFKYWLYGQPDRTCKEGNTHKCKAGTDSGKLPWYDMQ